MTRLLQIARLHTIAWPAPVGWPWAILASSFALTLAVFGIVGDDGHKDVSTGGITSLYSMVVVVTAGAVAQLFPYALGLSVTRRMFYAATSLVAVAQAVVYAVPLYLLRLVERATDGWGVSVRFFALAFLDVDNPVLQYLVYVVPLLVAGFCGMFIGTIHTRWGTTGVYTALLATTVAAAAAAALVTWRRGWSGIGHWFSDQSAATLFAGWPVVLAAAFAAAGFAVLRRATA